MLADIRVAIGEHLKYDGMIFFVVGLLTFFHGEDLSLCVTTCSDDAVGRGGVVEGKVEEDEASIIGNGRSGFTGLYRVDDF